MLAAVFATFTICYLTRTLYDFFVTPSLEFAKLFSGVNLPIIWDFSPIFMMLVYHYQNLRLLQSNKDKKKKVRRNERTSSALQ